jgi:hypothetical protein
MEPRRPAEEGVCTRLQVCEFLRNDICCCLCGGLFDQQFVSVAISCGAEELGHMCPYCLWVGPQRAAQRARRWHIAGMSPPLEMALARAEVMPAWSVTLADLMKHETDHLRLRFPVLREKDLRWLVEDRYRDYLSCAQPG